MYSRIMDINSRRVEKNPNTFGHKVRSELERKSSESHALINNQRVLLSSEALMVRMYNVKLLDPLWLRFKG